MNQKNLWFEEYLKEKDMVHSGHSEIDFSKDDISSYISECSTGIKLAYVINVRVAGKYCCNI